MRKELRARGIIIQGELAADPPIEEARKERYFRICQSAKSGKVPDSESDYVPPEKGIPDLATVALL